MYNIGLCIKAKWRGYMYIFCDRVILKFVIGRKDSSFFCISCSLYCEMAWNISALLISVKMANTSMLQKWAFQNRIGVLKHDKIADLVKVTWKTS